MTIATTEKRLTELETRLDALQRLLEERLPAPTQTGAKEKRGWESIVGTFANDPYYDEAMRLGSEWRESQRDCTTGEMTTTKVYPLSLSSTCVASAKL